MRAQRNPLNKEVNGRMVGWDNYKTVLDLNFLDETANGQHQAGADQDCELLK